MNILTRCEMSRDLVRPGERGGEGKGELKPPEAFAASGAGRSGCSGE